MNPFRTLDPASTHPPDNGERRTAQSNSSTGSLSGNGTVRAYVNFTSGARIVIPINVESTVSQLLTESTRRATALSIPIEGNAPVLRSEDGSILFGEDTLVDVLDLTHNNTFYLGSVENLLGPNPRAPSIPRSSVFTSTSQSPTEASSSSLSKVYIRWITAGRALEHNSLRSLPPDKSSVKASTSIAELRDIAFKRLYTENIPAEDVPPPNTTVELFTVNCHLSSHGEGCATLADLDLLGSKKHPLDIFVIPIGLRQSNSLGGQEWGFKSTNRAKATFQTCLTVYLKEIMDAKIDLGNMLEVLWELTHFPPALIALRELHQNGAGKLNPLACAIFVSSFRELCLRIVPPWISPSSESILESSRQIFAWLHSQPSKASQRAGGKHQLLVHRVELKEIQSPDEFSSTKRLGSLDFDACIDLRIQDVASEATSSVSSDSRKVLVCKERLDEVKPEVLAHALWGSYQHPYNFYFDISASDFKLHNHSRVELLHPQDFDNLLQTTNQVESFKMIGPLQLGTCTSSTLPVLTLDSEGYVSKYDQQDHLCGEREFYTENVFRKEVLSGSDPGQYLLQKLKPLLKIREKEGTLELDSWEENGTMVDSRTPEEGVVICVDQSGSMKTAMGSDWITKQSSDTARNTGDDLNRLSEVKEVFKNLVTRISAYRLPTYLGLVTFSSQEQVRINQQLTPVLYEFQDRLNDITPGGNTSIFDALVKAQWMLESFKRDYPAAKRRIILLTDGCDNSSRSLPSDVCRSLYNTDIVLDAIVIGTNNTADLFKIAKHTGGYAFNPNSRELLFQIFLLDGCIDIRTRPDIEKVPIRSYLESIPKTPDMQTKYDFPPCRPHARESDNFIALKDASRYFSNMSSRSRMSARFDRSISVSSRDSTWASDTHTLSGAGGQGRNFLQEIVAMIANPHTSMDVYVSESNMGFWKVVMSGPPNSAYERGTFLLFVDLGDQFPRQAPTARFITPVLHPNITKHGRICHEIFGREWHSGVRVYEVLQHIWSIFFSLEARDAVDPLFTLQFWTDPEGGRREVMQYVNHFALKTREQHRIEILDQTFRLSKPSTPAKGSSSLTAPIYTPSGTPSVRSAATENSYSSTSKMTPLRTPIHIPPRPSAQTPPTTPISARIPVGNSVRPLSSPTIPLPTSPGSDSTTASERPSFFRRFSTRHRT